MKALHRQHLLVLAGLIAGGCGPEVITEEDMADASCIDSHTLCVELLVPDGYAGEPSRLVTAMYDSGDTNRPPQGIMPEIPNPTIVAGEPYRLAHSEVDADGEYHLMFVLYDVSGGQWIPEADIDYVSITSQPVLFDGTPIDLGTMELTFAE